MDGRRDGTRDPPLLDGHALPGAGAGPNGKRIGTAESLEGDVDKDIFHGIVVKLEGSRELRELLADHITRITNRAVHTDVAEGELESLPPYTEERVYHLDWGGLFRKHPEWKEEPPV